MEETVDATNSIVPVVAANRPSGASPCACIYGWGFFGYMVEGEDGEEVEVFGAVPQVQQGG
jgi:hypothetical protein